MSFFERLTRWAHEMWEIVKPTDGTSLLSFIILVLLVIIALVLKKNSAGGFFKHFFKLIGLLVLALILYQISPVLFWIILGISVVRALVS